MSCVINTGPADSDASNQSFELYHHKIYPSSHPSSEIPRLFETSTIETKFASQILSSSQTHVCYLFDCVGLEDPSLVLQIKVLNWASAISQHDISTVQPSFTQCRPVLKLFYRFGKLSNSDFNALPILTGSAKKAETMFFHCEDIVQILSLLE